MQIILKVTFRVTNLKSEGMQNQSTSIFSVSSTLGKIETTPEIGKTLDKVCEIAILNHKQSTKNGYVTKRLCIGVGAPAEMYAAYLGHFKGLLTSVV